MAWAMRGLTTLALGSLVVSAGGLTWKVATAVAAGPRACPAGRSLPHALVRDGYQTMCGTARVVVVSERASYTIRRGYCTHARITFGVLGSGSAAHRGFAIVFAQNRAGVVLVIDGEAEFVPGIRVALSGTAVVAPGLKNGTFKVFGRGGRSGRTLTGRTFTGSWNCD
jgi:hypothetical protein